MYCGGKMISEEIQAYIREIFTEKIRPYVAVEKKYVIYTYGQCGQYIEQVLKEEYDIEACFVVDNVKCDGKKVLSLEEIDSKYFEGYYYIVCTYNPDIYEEVRNKLYKYVPRKWVIDIFPNNLDEEFISDINKHNIRIRIGRSIQYYIDKGERDFVVVSSGLMSKYVEHVLKECYCINPKFLIDCSKKTDNRHLESMASDDKNFFLLCEQNIKNREKVRRLLKNVGDNRIIDIFPEKVGEFGYIYNSRLICNKTNTRFVVANSFSEYLVQKKCIVFWDDLLSGNLLTNTKYPRSQFELKSFVSEYMNRKMYEDIVKGEEEGVFAINPGVHIIPGYDRLIDFGIDGIKKELEKHKKSYEYYISMNSLLDAFSRMIQNYGRTAYSMYLENKERKNLLHIADVCEKISCKAPETFEEALQLMLFAHETVLDEGGSGSISFGRIDQYLYRFYKNDVQNKRLSKERAYMLIEAFWKKLGERTMSWQNVTLGGKDSNGYDMCNELTIMCLDVAKRQNSDQPQVSLRCHRDMNEQVWKKSFSLVSTGKGFPEYYNDDIAVKTKLNLGMSAEDAWNYGIVGCVEISAGGKEYSHNEAMRINWAKVLLIYLDEEINKKNEQFNLILNDNETFGFDIFFEKYKRKLVEITKRACSFLMELADVWGKVYPTPFTSLLMEDCVEKELDVTECGTKYNYLTINSVGVATTVDSLQVIKELVFESEKLSLNELVEEMKNNFENNDILEMTRRCKKYGNDIDEVDFIAKDLVDTFTNALKECYSGENRNGVQAGFYSSYFHGYFGKKTGATPDGRKQKAALSASLDPVSGMDSNGTLAVLNSANKISMETMGNGCVLDLKFLPTFFDNQNNLDALKNLITCYFDHGGLELQFNVINPEELIEAQKHPEKYAHLVVRVSGYSTYFTLLDKNVQDEIIARTLHEV